MKKMLLFVESNTTGTGMLAIRKANQLGYSPIFLTNRPERYVGLKEQHCDIIECETNSLDELRQTIQTHVSREQLAGITTTSDFYTETVAQLNQLYGFPGNSVQAIRNCRNKCLTRLRLQEAGVQQPDFIIVDQIPIAPSLLHAIELPCIVKPVDDSGSNNVKLCFSLLEIQEQAEKILSNKVNIRGQQTDQRILIEQYLAGQEYSVEMFSINGRHHCIGITEKRVQQPPYFVESGHIFPAQLTQEVYDWITSFVENALDAVGITFGPTHTEIKQRKDGTFSIVEINPRLAGGMIPELIRLSTGVDVLEAQLRSVVQPSFTLTPIEHKQFAGIQFLLAEQEGTLLKVAGIERAKQLLGVKKITISKSPQDRVQPAQNAYDRLGSIIVCGHTYQEATERLQAAHSSLHIVMEQE